MAHILQYEPKNTNDEKKIIAPQELLFQAEQSYKKKLMKQIFIRKTPTPIEF